MNPATVERVIDGDTFVLGVAHLGFNVRIGGIKIRVKDYLAPERGAPGGSAATTYARELFESSAATIAVLPFEDRMTFERYVCDVWIAGVLFRELMVKAGHGSYVQFYKVNGQFAYRRLTRGNGDGVSDVEVFV